MKICFIFFIITIFFMNGCVKSEQEKLKIIDNINPEENLPRLSLDKDCAFIRSVRLELTPESMIGDIHKVFRIKNQIFIWDWLTSNIIYKFDINGRFLSKTKRGFGPNEHGILLDVSIDTTASLLYLNDQTSQNIVVMDYDLNVINKMSQNISFNDMFVANGLLYGIYDSGHGPEKKTIITQKPGIKKYNLFLPKFVDYAVANTHSFSSNQNKIYYLDNFRYKIFSLSKTKIKPEYLLNLKDELKINPNNSVDENKKLIIHKGEVIAFIDEFMIDDNIIHFSYLYRNYRYNLVYDRNNDKVYKFRGFGFEPNGNYLNRINISKELYHTDDFAVTMRLFLEPINKEFYLIFDPNSDHLQNPTLVFFKLRERSEVL